MCDGWTAHCQHWCALWDAIDDVGCQHIVVHKTQAHRRLQQANSVDDEFCIKGNSYADAYAKLGAQQHPHDAGAYEAVKHTLQCNKAVAQYIARFALAWVKEHPRTDKLVKVSAEQSLQTPGKKSSDVDAHNQFQDTELGRWRCRVCLRSSKDRLKGACSSSRLDSSHALHQAGPYLFCTRCGCFSRDRVRNLASSCRPCSEVRAQLSLNRLKAGCDPYSGLFVGRPARW